LFISKENLVKCLLSDFLSPNKLFSPELASKLSKAGGDFDNTGEVIGNNVVLTSENNLNFYGKVQGNQNLSIIGKNIENNGAPWAYSQADRAIVFDE